MKITPPPFSGKPPSADSRLNKGSAPPRNQEATASDKSGNVPGATDTAAVSRNSNDAGEAPAARLISLLSRPGLSVSTAEAQAIGNELARLGLQLSDLDGDAALKALLLYRSNIPLLSEFLKGSAGSESMVFRQLGALYDQAAALLSDSAISGEMRSILTAFVRDIGSALSADISIQSVIRDQILAGNAAAFPDGAVFGEPDTGIPLSPDGTGIRNLFLNNGLMFEWKLLAWYRSGADLSRLNNLLHNDLKGILTGLRAKLSQSSPKSKAGKKLESFDRDAKSLIDGIGRRQVSMILDNRTIMAPDGDVRRDMSFELPFGDLFGGDSVRIRVRGRKKPDSEMLDPGDFSVFFDVETSNLGIVQATMYVLGKTVSFSFVMESDQAVDRANSMKDDLAKSLEVRGYTVGSVSIGLNAGDVSADTVGATMTGSRGNRDAGAARSKGVDLKG